MCGICGVFERQGDPPDLKVVERMNESLRHRGPDDAGLREDGPAILAMRRLSVLDLDHGTQPMTDGATGMTLVYNGEIYNHRELREELEGKGHRFRTLCDTEVVLALLSREGKSALGRLNGMYALALWDPKDRTLLLARDPYGIKPLYYHLEGRRLIWSSELRSLVSHPAISRQVDPTSLALYLVHEYVPTPHCILKGVRKLEPGSWLEVTIGKTRAGQFRPQPFTDPIHPPSLPDAVDQFHGHLEDAVRRQLVADVPVGIFLSGGLDSSALAAAAVRVANSKIQTYSIGFEDATFDESSHARRVAAHLDTEHGEEILTSRQALSLAANLGHLLDEPLGDASLIPTSLLCEYSRRHVTVALSGDGGDELFGGYPTYPAHRLARAYRLLGPLGPHLLAPLVRRLPVSHKNFSLDFKAKRFVRGAHRPNPYRHILWMGSFHPEAMDQILRPDWARQAGDAWAASRLRWQEVGEGPDWDRVRQFDFLTYLRDDLLPKTDRASMACSLEVRVPFLDDVVVGWAESLPPDLRVRGMQTKVLMRAALRSRLPEEILARPKKGFGVPMAQWLRGPLRELMQDLLAPDSLAREGIFRPEAVQALVDDHIRGRRDERKCLWTLIAYRLWSRSFLERGD